MSAENNQVFFHADCYDGATAAAVARMHLPDDTIFTAYRHGTSFDVWSAADVLYFLDCAPLPDLRDQLLQNGYSVVILDHHETIIRAYADAGEIVGVLDASRSGALIAWDWFAEDTPAPAMVRYVSDADLYTWKLPSSRERNAGLRRHLPTLEAMHNELKRDMESPSAAEHHIAAGRVLLEAQNKEVSFAVEHAGTIQIAGFTAPVANVPLAWSSDVGHALALDAPFSATFRVMGDSVHWSLRSGPDGANVAVIAERFGGGGHAHAAGFRTSLMASVDLFSTIKPREQS